MVFWHLKSKRKKTGGRAKRNRKKRKFERGGYFIPTKIGKNKVKVNRVRGGNIKLKLLNTEFVNVAGKKYKILQVLENKANFRFEREKIITKGAILETEHGKVKVTSRPGQDGIVNGVFVK
ncbi:MAG TPA: 30S ribosomal protein S8e [Candidatus Aenigmarchaeota archaeon]|nr:30S ribosomal protein S8e [Candidatus Aenigmarchaeota archaeon]